MRKHDSKIVASIITAIASIIVAFISIFGTRYYDSIEISTYKTEILDLKNQINDLSSQIDVLAYATERPTEITSEIATKAPETEESKVNVNNNENSHTYNTINSTEVSKPNLVAVGWSDKNTYKFYSGNGNNGFTMFGKSYTNGFTISMGASYNVWGNGTQYVTYNVDSISNEFSSIKILVGHIDGYSSDDIKVEFFLDKSLEDSSDYEFTIHPTVSPEWISINIEDHSAMTIQVSNLGGDSNCIGFADISFE